MKGYKKRINDKNKRDRVFSFIASIIMIVVSAEMIKVELDEKVNGIIENFRKYFYVFIAVIVLFAGIFFFIYSIHLFLKKNEKEKYLSRENVIARIIDNGNVIYENEYFKIVDSVFVNKKKIEQVAYIDEIRDVTKEIMPVYQGGDETYIQIKYDKKDGRYSYMSIPTGILTDNKVSFLVYKIKSYCPYFNGKMNEVNIHEYEEGSFEEAFVNDHYVPDDDIVRKSGMILGTDKPFRKTTNKEVFNKTLNTTWMSIMSICLLGGVCLLIDEVVKIINNNTNKNSSSNFIVSIVLIIISLLTFVVTFVIIKKKSNKDVLKENE